MGDRLCPVDEAMRLVRCMTAEERLRFMAWMVSAPDVQRRRLPLDSGPPPLVRLDREPGR